MARSNGGAARGNITTSWQTRGKQEEMRQWTRGDGVSRGRGCASRGRDGASRGREAEASTYNQLANKQQTGGDGISKASGFVERTRGGGSGAMRGVAATSWGTRGKGEGRHQQTRGICVSKAGGASIQREAEVSLQEDTRRRQRVVKTRGRGRGGATRCNGTTSQCKLKVNGR